MAFPLDYIECPYYLLESNRAGRERHQREVEVMEIVRQVSVFLENKPGRLAQLLSALAREKVNLVALTVMDHHEQGVLRFLASDPTRAVQALKNLGVPYF